LSDGSDLTSELVDDDRSAAAADDAESNSVHDNRINISYTTYQDFMSIYHEQSELCGQLHSHIEQV